MSLLRATIAAVLLLAFLVPAPAQASITTTFVIDYETYPVVTEAGSHTCTVTVPDGAVVAALLDAATATGCISGWHGTSFGEAGRFVDMIDDKESYGQAIVVYTWWAVLANGALTANGVDFEPVQGGTTYEFEYRLGSAADWL